MNWIKCNDWKDLPDGEWLVKVDSECYEYHVARVTRGVHECRIVTVGNRFQCDMGNIKAYSSFDRYEDKPKQLNLSEIDQDIFDSGHVNKEKPWNNVHESRGWYIGCRDPRYYLHHDGKIRDSVIDTSGTGKDAFWSTRHEAQEFLENWRSERLGE